jgi:DNA topoisomerase-3
VQLWIAEKPSLARAIAAELGVISSGEGFLACGSRVVTWCYGHLFEQGDPDEYTASDVPRGKNGKKVWRVEDLPIIPSAWILRPKQEAKKQLLVISGLLERASEVVHAGDPDREGQLLVDEVLEHFKFQKTVLRFWVSAQDAVSIRRGLSNLQNNQAFAGMANAARARQRADWLIGMNLSRAYTLRAQRAGSTVLLTVGRVQTPTLAIVVRRDREVEAFSPRRYFKLEAQVEHRAGTFSAAWEPKEGQLGLDEQGRLVDGLVANELVGKISSKPGTIEAYATQIKKQAPPRCFALSELTLLASQRFGHSAEQVLEACQSLYETHRLTSYPRTDCGYLPESQHADAPDVLDAVAQVNPELCGLIDRADRKLRSPTWNDRKISAHHGIIPTGHRGDTTALGPVEREIYELVVRRYIAQFFVDHEFLETRVSIELGGERFTAIGKSVTQSGWREVEGDAPKYEPNDEEASSTWQTQPLPTMHERDNVRCTEARCKDARTKAPSRFTEGTLVRAMEQIHRWVTDPEHKKVLRDGDGIGTPATRAAILSDLRRRQFLESRGKHLLSTGLGRALVDAMPELVKSPTLTALYERMLQDVEHGRAALDDFVDRQANFVAERVAHASSAAVTLPTGAQPQARRRTHARRKVRRPRAGRKEERHV